MGAGSAPRFGTDGVRGVALTELTTDFVEVLGRAAVSVLGGHRWLVARDTRESGASLEQAVARGIVAGDADAVGRARAQLPQARLPLSQRDAQVVLEKLSVSVASGSISPLRTFTEHATPTWRRRRVSMDDVTDLYEGLRIAVATVLAGGA